MPVRRSLRNGLGDSSIDSDARSHHAARDVVHALEHAGRVEQRRLVARGAEADGDAAGAGGSGADNPALPPQLVMSRSVPSLISIASVPAWPMLETRASGGGPASMMSVVLPADNR